MCYAHTLSRPLRIEYPGAVYHVTARGNAREAIFKDDTDRKNFLVVLGKIVERYHWLCHAYCLMGNHYHLLIETPDGNLSQGMRQLNGVYTQTFNRRHRRVGHVLQGRFKAILIDKDSYLLELGRYIVLNPVRAKRVKHPKHYAWSSYRATAGLSNPPALLTREWLLSQFGQHRKTAEARYRAFVAQGTGQPSPWDKLSGQILLGSEVFVKKMTGRLKAAESLHEIPRRRRLAARPALNALFPKQGFKNKTARDKAIHQAHRDHGYTLVEIGRALSLHYTTISKVVNRDGGRY